MGLFLGFFSSIYYVNNKIRKQVDSLSGEDQKDHIRSMFEAFGQRPSEEQINRMMTMAKQAVSGRFQSSSKKN
jgi:uncharacterized protein YneF (UPF0154 family)